MNRRLILPLMVTAAVLAGGLLYAEEFRVAVKDLPQAKEYSEMIRAIIEATGNTAAIQVVPVARADYLVSNKEVDIQFPIAVDPDVSRHKDLKYDFSTIVLWKTPWVLYTNKTRPIDLQSLNGGNPRNYKIEITPSRAGDYKFKGIPSTNYEASFKKLESGVIDGIILSQPTGDEVLRKLGLNTIKRQLWLEMVSTFSLPKGMRGGAADKMLEEGIRKLRANGTYDRYIGVTERGGHFDDWQP